MTVPRRRPRRVVTFGSTRWPKVGLNPRTRHDVGAPRYVLGVMTHQENRMAALEQFSRYLGEANDHGIACVSFVGEPRLASEWDYDETLNALALKCPDDYVNLPRKVYSFLAAVRDLFPGVVGVFKTDDDTAINVAALSQLLNKNRRLDYFGLVVPGTDLRSDYLRGKQSITQTFPELADYPIGLRPGSYCAGGGYFLSQRAVDVILSAKTDFMPFPSSDYMSHLGTDGVFHGLNVFEDKTVGLVLAEHGIRAVDRRRPLSKAVRWENMEMFLDG